MNLREFPPLLRGGPHGKQRYRLNGANEQVLDAVARIFHDQIYRVMAAFLLPELRLESPLDRLTQRKRQGRDPFDELIEYIKANLSEPLNLTMLESRIHYSRRALQYAFKGRLGCTATQWIRSQRLDLARIAPASRDEGSGGRKGLPRNR